MDLPERGVMTDSLTRSLHEAAEALPDGIAAPAQIRHRAERARRIRRVVAAATAASVVFLLGTIVATRPVGGRKGPPNFATAIPTRTSDSVFTSDPLLSAAEWNDVLEHTPAERTERTTAAPRPLDCINDPYRLGAAQARGAAYLQPARSMPGLLSAARMNLYALWFTGAGDAAATVTRLRQELASCRAAPSPSLTVTHSSIQDWLMRDYPRIEQQFARGVAIKSATGGRNARFDAYSLTVARAGRLVIVFESLNGWSDRPQNTVGLLMNHALGALSPLVAPTK
jgi:hypothetical protein